MSTAPPTSKSRLSVWGSPGESVSARPTGVSERELTAVERASITSISSRCVKSERDIRRSYGVGRGTTRRCGTRCRHSAWGGSAYGGGGIGSYSSEVPQRVWIPVDCWVLAGTVTCGDGRGWTGCRWMVCRSKIGFRFDLSLLGFQAARSYSLIRPLRTGFRRIWHVPGLLR